LFGSVVVFLREQQAPHKAAPKRVQTGLFCKLLNSLKGVSDRRVPAICPPVAQTRGCGHQVKLLPVMLTIAIPTNGRDEVSARPEFVAENDSGDYDPMTL
jgi:hypothetical protein